MLDPMSLSRRAIITCGPSITPIDAVRRITNFSTGELGVRLAECLLENGWQVVCFKGSTATYRNPEGEGLVLREFSTNDDLKQLLSNTEHAGEISVVFHAAALSDYEVDSIQTLDGNLLEARKISSRLSGVQLFLRPAPKLLPEIPRMFPKARIVGWKFELEGDREQALETARKQITDNKIALSILNGTAFGEGFGILDPQGACQIAQTRSELCQKLADWANRLLPA